MGEALPLGPGGFLPLGWRCLPLGPGGVYHTHTLDTRPPSPPITNPPPPPPWTEWITNACENVTLSQTSFVAPSLSNHIKTHLNGNGQIRSIKQECIPVGCVPLVHWSYLCISSYPAYIPPRPTMHTPPEQPCTPPRSNHACPLGATMHTPQEQPCMPPPPRTTTHTCKNITFANYVCGR